MKYLKILISMGAIVFLLEGCAEKPLVPAAEIHTPDEQTTTIDGEKYRLPVAV